MPTPPGLLPFWLPGAVLQLFFLISSQFQGYRAALSCPNNTELQNGNRFSEKTGCHFSFFLRFGNKRAKQACSARVQLG
jgi:hypothetical protein